jgi:hypothetical protein
MEEGFVLDRGDSGNAASIWLGGAPQKSFWTGLKLKGRPTHDIATWRCRRCFYLESWAPGA